MLGQQTTTSVRGVVADTSGAVIPGVAIDLNDNTADVHKIIMSDNKGEYQFVQLIPDKYTIKVEYPGMGKQEKTVELLVAQPATVNFSLAASDSTVVVVEAADAALNTTDATIGNAVDSQTVAALPMEGRNVPDLLSLQPGVL